MTEILERYMVPTAEIARDAFQKRLDAEGLSAPEAPTSVHEEGAGS